MDEEDRSSKNEENLDIPLAQETPELDQDTHIKSVLSKEEPSEDSLELVDQNELRRLELIDELDALVKRVQLVTGYYAPPFSRERLIYLLRKNLSHLSTGLNVAIFDQLFSIVREDIFDFNTWKGVWYLINYSLDQQLDFVKRRMRGEYETDEWGFDPEFMEAVAPFISFMYETYWRVEATGIANIPGEGRAMLVSNHSGQLPWDGVMISAAVYKEHPSQRLVRNMFDNWFVSLPFFSTILTKLGQILANQENGIRLLEKEELVAIYPEGTKGVGKLFKDRYRLARFGRGGFVRVALQTGSMIIPVSVVGAEETYISIAKSQFIADLIHFPFFPISLRWPLLGPLALIPFPTKWYIDFGEPILTETYGVQAADNLVLVSQLTDQVRNVIQEMVYERLSKRKSVFLG